MPFSLSLADRLRDCLDRYPNIVEKKIFGGLGFLLHGNMLLGIWRDYLILRLGPEQAKVALKQKKFKVFDITGKPMKGWVMIHEEDLADDLMLKKWLQIAMEFVITLPARKKVICVTPCRTACYGSNDLNAGLTNYYTYIVPSKNPSSQLLAPSAPSAQSLSSRNLILEHAHTPS